MKPKPVTVKIKADTRYIIPAISELKFHLNGLGQFIEYIRKFFLHAEKRSSELGKLVQIETKTAIGKRTVTVVLFKPSQLLLDILSACRTGKFNDFIIKNTLHKQSPKRTKR